jgi:general secretion pathway protein A
MGEVAVYEGAFGLRAKPFALTPDPDFLFLSEGHQRALDHLIYGVTTGEGFIVLTGEVGSGKTTLCRTLLRRLPQETTTALVLNPLLTECELVRGILRDFGVKPPHTKSDALAALDRFLLAEAEAGRRAVLIIDEAQDLSPALLELVRLLSNLETEKQKLLQIVLVGQSELKRKLQLEELRQLNQRITVRAELAPLSRAETERYVGHRLAVVGGGGRSLVSPGAFGALRRRSGGVPRLINVLCDRAFLAAYLRDAARVEAKDVRRAAASVDGGASWPRLRRWATSAAAAVVAAIALSRRGTP